MSEWNHGWSLWWEHWRQEELRWRIRTQDPCTRRDSIWENAVTSLSIMDVFLSRGPMKARQIWRSLLWLDSCCCAPTLTKINAGRKEFTWCMLPHHILSLKEVREGIWRQHFLSWEQTHSPGGIAEPTESRLRAGSLAGSPTASFLI